MALTELCEEMKVTDPKAASSLDLMETLRAFLTFSFLNHCTEQLKDKLSLDILLHSKDPPLFPYISVLVVFSFRLTSANRLFYPNSGTE